MDWHLAPVPFIAVGTWITWRARNREDYRTVAFFQPATTVLTVAVAVLALFTPNAHLGFTLWILAGLGLSLAGDLFNINMTRDDILYAALLVFLVAYLVYPIGIAVYDGFHREDLWVAAGLLAAYVALFAYVWNNLEPIWRIAGLVYMLAMLFMVSRGIGTWFGDFFGTTQALLLSAGTSMLFIADSEYSIHRFKRPFRTIIGPILYPTGQLFIALSPAYFPAG
jgi:uncharacterized membrane protein YhhN